MLVKLSDLLLCITGYVTLWDCTLLEKKKKKINTQHSVASFIPAQQMFTRRVCDESIAAVG